MKKLIVAFLIILSTATYATNVVWRVKVNSSSENIEKIEYKLNATLVSEDMVPFLSLNTKFIPFASFTSEHDAEIYDSNHKYKLKVEQDFFKSNKYKKVYKAEIIKNGKVINEKIFTIKTILMVTD